MFPIMLFLLFYLAWLLVSYRFVPFSCFAGISLCQMKDRKRSVDQVSKNLVLLLLCSRPSIIQDKQTSCPCLLEGLDRMITDLKWCTDHVLNHRVFLPIRDQIDGLQSLPA